MLYLGLLQNKYSHKLHSNMSNKSTVFYRGNVEISSDGSVILLEKLERKHKLIT